MGCGNAIGSRFYIHVSMTVVHVDDSVPVRGARACRPPIGRRHVACLPASTGGGVVGGIHHLHAP